MTLFNKKMNFFEHGKKIQSFFYNFLNVEHKFSKFVSSRLILRNLQFNWQKELFLRIFVYIIITNLFKDWESLSCLILIAMKFFQHIIYYRYNMIKNIKIDLFAALKFLKIMTW